MNYPKELLRLESEIESIEKKVGNLKREWIEKDCPVKVGDIVVVNTYTFIGKKMQIDAISLYEGGGWQWAARGKVIKNDGKVGLQNGIWRQKIKS